MRILFSGLWLLFWPLLVGSLWAVYKSVRLYRSGDVLRAVFWMCAFIAMFQVWRSLFGR